MVERCSPWGRENGLARRVEGVSSKGGCGRVGLWSVARSSPRWHLIDVLPRTMLVQFDTKAAVDETPQSWYARYVGEALAS